MANYVSNYTGAEVDAILTKADSIPAPTAQDIDKVLAVGANGLEWAEGAGSSTLPEYDFADGGKILAVSSESGDVELVWENNVKIPSTTNNNGKVLKVINANGTVGWATESTGIPNYSQVDEGKVLGISSNTVTWITNSGGGGGGTSLPEQQYSGTEQILIIDDNGDLDWKSLEDMYITSSSTIGEYVDSRISSAISDMNSSGSTMGGDDDPWEFYDSGYIARLQEIGSAAYDAYSNDRYGYVLAYTHNGFEFVDPSTLLSN